MGKQGNTNETPTGGGLLGVLLKALSFAFALFLTYRFLAEVATVGLTLAALSRRTTLAQAPPSLTERLVGWQTTCV